MAPELTLENVDAIADHLRRHASDAPVYQHYIELLVKAAKVGFAQSESERTWKPGDTRVVCAALMDASGRVVTGPRHFDGTMMEQIKRGPDVDAWRGAEQGFVDQKGHFLTREQAHEIATRQGQIIRRVGSDEMSLFSENLY